MSRLCSFKETKSMKALLEERSKRNRKKSARDLPADASTGKGTDDLQTLVERVKRKSAAAGSGSGKRRKLI